MRAWGGRRGKPPAFIYLPGIYDHGPGLDCYPIGKQEGRLKACLSCLIAAAVWVVGFGGECGRRADWRTGALAHGSLVRLGIPVLLGSLSNERPAALDPDRATGPWVSLISPESPLGGGRVFPRRETSDSQTATTMRPMPSPCPAPAHHQNEASPQASPIADC
ncbi:hypothetical protein NA56DRAFT_701088 [Hyaloscypha hepaticicola]|uniref:Uncharacterized protein n=1 Tax=Hyaloscypha hepaticicola TaxID=2082293 RepID=A0A2J6QBT3_9HELO|nr:hypothetical protein NA56DRAFT_701088 [Hyaloscypha hepaticicola]